MTLQILLIKMQLYSFAVVSKDSVAKEDGAGVVYQIPCSRSHFQAMPARVMDDPETETINYYHSRITNHHLSHHTIPLPPVTVFT